MNYPSNAPDGDYSKLILNQVMNTCPGIAYEVSVALKVAGDPRNSNTYFFGGFGDGGFYYQDNFGLDNPTGYNLITTSFTAQSSSETARFTFVCGTGSTMTWEVDSVSIVPKGN
ncbi:hypothetical protein LTR56_026765 [Elasticomyces elasticus]|nr:hypothetical protein LTR56_026765 [Elasticomyces elasticus]KAK4905025.1 hypothetical protein LTR49_025623 [Elasticomyces elasticus]KAK5736285.1 hypothetical protein LTS12_026236 [Elasticomyces elasticus]